MTKLIPSIELSTELLASAALFSVPDRRSRRKWNGPWWDMAVLCEMGEAQRIPKSTTQRAMELLKNGTWPRFVISAADAPQTDSDRQKMDCCHCELGVCSKLDREVINNEWLKPLFPRFFEYDILRGLAYLVEWSKRREKLLPETVIAEGLGRLRSYIGKNGVILGRHVNDRTAGWNGRTFPLLKSVSRVGKTSPYLARQLDTVLQAVHQADQPRTMFK